MAIQKLYDQGFVFRNEEGVDLMACAGDDVQCGFDVVLPGGVEEARGLIWEDGGIGGSVKDKEGGVAGGDLPGAAGELGEVFAFPRGSAEEAIDAGAGDVGELGLIF